MVTIQGNIWLSYKEYAVSIQGIYVVMMQGNSGCHARNIWLPNEEYVVTIQKEYVVTVRGIYGYHTRKIVAIIQRNMRLSIPYKVNICGYHTKGYMWLPYKGNSGYHTRNIW